MTARRLAFATNAYTHLFEQLDRLQVPAFTYMIATEPLTEAQLAPIGWSGLHPSRTPATSFTTTG